MKFVVIRSNLKEALGLAERAAGDVPNLPVLRNALLQAKDGRITLTATNLEIATTVEVPGKVIDQGGVVVPLSLLAGLLGNLQSDRLNVESKDNRIEIKTDNYTAGIQGSPADNFPQVPAIKNKEQWIGVKGIILKEALQQVMAASQLSELRPELNSVLFDFSVDNLKLAATDGFRLAEKTISKNSLEISEEIEPFRVLVPLKTTYEVSRCFTNEDMVRIYRDENQVLFKVDRLEIVSRLIDAQFPEYSQLIPKDFSNEIIVDKEEFTAAIKVVSVLGQKNNEVVLTLKQDKKTLMVHSADQTMGENEYLLPVKAKGEGLDVIFNWRYLADAVKAMPEKDIFFGFQEETNPALIKSPANSSYFYILKPLMKG